MGIETALLVGTLASVASAAYGAKQQGDARKDAKKAAADSQAQQTALQSQYKQQVETDNSAQIAQQARDRQRSLALTASGQQSTIKTSPIGLSTPAPTAQKSLLGS